MKILLRYSQENIDNFYILSFNLNKLLALCNSLTKYGYSISFNITLMNINKKHFFLNKYICYSFLLICTNRILFFHFLPKFTSIICIFCQTCVFLFSYILLHLFIMYQSSKKSAQQEDPTVTSIYFNCF